VALQLGLRRDRSAQVQVTEGRIAVPMFKVNIKFGYNRKFNPSSKIMAIETKNARWTFGGGGKVKGLVL
jgi:hypothetical protein